MNEQQWDEITDVIVVGSGGAGLSAALSASSGGAGVCVLERSKKFGGTTAMSGGVAWIPAPSKANTTLIQRPTHY